MTTPLFSDLAGLSQPLTKLIETISWWGWKFYEPTYIRRIAMAHAQEVEILGRAEKENSPLSVLNNQTGDSIENPLDRELINRTANRMLSQEVAKQQNIESVINISYELLKQEEKVSEEPVDPDWIIRFMNSVEDISNEQMQYLWGRILAGEISKPRSFSLRTLETVRNLTQEEAQLLMKLAKYAFHDQDQYHLLEISKEMDKRWWALEDILLLQDANLIVESLLSYTVNIIPNEKKTLFITPYIGILENNSAQTIVFGVNKFTKSGNELLSILDFDSDLKYLIDFFTALKNKHKDSGLQVGLHKITEIVDGSIRFETANLLNDDETKFS